MAEFSYPFDGGTGSILTEDDWSNMASQWQDDGVIVGNTIGSTALTVDSVGDPNTVFVLPGSAIIQGFMYRNTANLPITFATNTDATHQRRDRVVLRLDRTTNTIQALVKQGTPSTTPIAPGLDTTYPIYEISLATFFIAASGSTVAHGAVLPDRPVISRYIQVSDNTLGHPEGSILYTPTANKFYTVGTGGDVTQIGAPQAAPYFLKVKDADGAALSGSGVIVDPDLSYTFPSAGRYRVCGEVVISANTASATANFSLTSVPTPTWVRGIFRKYTGISQFTNLTTTSAQIASIAVDTYGISYDFLFNVTGSQDVALRTNAHSGSSVWRILQGSYIRVEKVTDW